jgi:hypothetical protein
VFQLTGIEQDALLADTEKVEEIFEVAHGPTSIHLHSDNGSPTTPMPDNARQSRFYNFLLKNTSAGRQQDDLNPLPSQVLFLWHIYLENVDPFIKVLHVPSITKAIHKLKGDYQSIDPSMHAIVMVVSFAAVMSLEDRVVRVPAVKLDFDICANPFG